MMDSGEIAAFEKRFEAFRYTPELTSRFTTEEIRDYLWSVAGSTLEYRVYPIYNTLFREFPPDTWLPVIYDLLDTIKLMPQGVPYSPYNSMRAIRREDGSWSDETYETYHPAMQLIYVALRCFPDYFTERLHLLFLNDLSPGRVEEALLWKNHGHRYAGFFKAYLSEKRTDVDAARAIQTILLTNDGPLKEFAREVIPQYFKSREDIHLLNSYLKAAGVQWKDHDWVYLHSQKPLHLIFPENFLKRQSHESFHPRTALPGAYDWGGWQTVYKPSGKKLRLQHLITLDPVPENLAIKSVKRIAFVIDMDMVYDEGAGTYYQHTENGDVMIGEEDVWAYEGPDDYASEHPAFRACQVRLADLGEKYLIQGREYDENNFRIGGIPHFVQDYYYPACKCCHEKMPYVMQMDSYIPQEDGEEFLWGSGGMGYLYWCDHCRVSCICWSCT